MRFFNNEDIISFKEGKLYDAYDIFGAHLYTKNNLKKTRFCVYAPHAKKVYVVGDFDLWKGSLMVNYENSGFWYIDINEDLSWNSYKYKIITKNDEEIYKSDPYAFFSDLRAGTNSKVYNLDGYLWKDKTYNLENRKNYNDSFCAYEVHLGSFKYENNTYKNYKVIIEDIIKHVKKHNFTHVEIMPIYEYPLDGSWGYQGTGYFSVTARYGIPKDYMYLIDRCHQEKIGVIMDWVPGHFCKDNHGLYKFDGDFLFEYSDEWKRENLVWGTANMDLGSGPVRSFLISNALFWMKYFHVDGFRVDAVSNIIYYLGEKNNGVNNDAIMFLKLLSTNIFKYDDRALLIAEDSTNYNNVTKPANDGGLGFNYKWNMGWMNDVLAYFELDPIHRKYHHNNIVFGIDYAYNEQYILPFSHDEVVHGKRSLLNKMPGDYWQKFANYRLLIGLWLTYPGKKLIFMGGEFAQFSEWKFDSELDWSLFDYQSHREANRYFIEVMKIYKNQKSLYEKDNSKEGFKWIDCNNSEQSIFSYYRFSAEDYLIVILNATPNTYNEYNIGVFENCSYEELLNSDSNQFGGSNKINEKIINTQEGKTKGFDFHINITIPPLGIIVLKKMLEVKQ